MTPKTKRNIQKLAQRMLAVQLEIYPRRTSGFEFYVPGFHVTVNHCPEWNWFCVAWPRDAKEGISIPI